MNVHVNNFNLGQHSNPFLQFCWSNPMPHLYLKVSQLWHSTLLQTFNWKRLNQIQWQRKRFSLSVAYPSMNTSWMLLIPIVNENESEYASNQGQIQSGPLKQFGWPRGLQELNHLLNDICIPCGKTNPEIHLNDHRNMAPLGEHLVNENNMMWWKMLIPSNSLEFEGMNQEKHFQSITKRVGQLKQFSWPRGLQKLNSLLNYSFPSSLHSLRKNKSRYSTH